MQETQEIQVQYLGQKESLEKEMATHSSILAWKIPGTEEPGGLQSVGSQRVGHDWVTEHTQLLYNAMLVSAVQQRELTHHLLLEIFSLGKFSKNP